MNDMKDGRTPCKVRVDLLRGSFLLWIGLEKQFA